MRIIIANHIDPSIRDRTDLWAWTQRALWGARNGDLVVLCAPPDPGFLRYATALTGTDPGRLHLVTAPPGQYGHRLLDPQTLTHPGLLDQVRTVLAEHGGAQAVQEVWALWPSASVARFAAALGLSERLPGAGFLAQGGGELVNNKSTFRMFAAAAGTPVAAGTVVRGPGEATAATQQLLEDAGAVVVKQAHNGAGVGNELLLADPLLATGHAGARHLHQLDGTDLTGDITAYWSERWTWASADGRFPVVLEEFIPDARTVYCEQHLTDTHIQLTEMGELRYTRRRLSHESVPLRDLTPPVRQQLLDGSARLAATYLDVGYRGRLSTDAIVTPDGQVLFTEVNAQVTGSWHIYEVFAHHIVDANAAPERTVTESHVPAHWTVPDGATFHRTLTELSLAYDPATRAGVIVSMPIVDPPSGTGSGAQFTFSTVYDTPAGHDAIWTALDTRFSARCRAAA
ncbi:preATP grasp domain-containing protein [Streptomyces sp. NPDC001443]